MEHLVDGIVLGLWQRLLCESRLIQPHESKTTLHQIRCPASVRIGDLTPTGGSHKRYQGCYISGVHGCIMTHWHAWPHAQIIY